MSHNNPRNTSRAVFTSHERDLARHAWGLNRARLSRESFLPFAACRLCLEPARDPVVACAAAGDLFCRECALADILAQRREIKREARQREREGRDADEGRARHEAEERDRAVREFELVQAGLGPRAAGVGGGGGGGDGGGRSKKRRSGKEEEEQEHEQGHDQERITGGDDDRYNAGSPSRRRREDNSSNPVENGEKRGEKRKFELDAEELERIAAEDRAKARRAIDDEKAAKPTLPSFWTPSVTPSSNRNNALHEVKKKVKSSPVCPASLENQPHAYSLHTLVAVQFAEERDSKTEERQRVCPSCKKALSNASKAMLAKPCGHVICGSCVKQFMKPTDHDPHAPDADAGAVRCYVCDADLTERKGASKAGKGDKDKEKIRPGLVSIRSEGTGFSASGSNEVKKKGANFVC